eukprot:403353217
MDFNYFIFPVPDSTYPAYDYAPYLLFIPRKFPQSSPVYPTAYGYSDYNIPALPCLYLPYLQGSNNLIIYFHGNSKDLGLLTTIEYPGYGIYPAIPSAEAILQYALPVWDQLTYLMCLITTENTLSGMSLAAGPSTELPAYVHPTLAGLQLLIQCMRDP